MTLVLRHSQINKTAADRNFKDPFYILRHVRYRLKRDTGVLERGLGSVGGIVPWIMGGMYFWVSTNNIADSIPAYAQFGFLLTFLFFNTFAINMWLQYKKVGKWKLYEFGEKGYIDLSLVSKSILAWVVVIGTLNV